MVVSNLDRVRRTASRAHDLAAAAEAAREARDEAIDEADGACCTVREIARAAELAPISILRILRRVEIARQQGGQ